VTELVRRGRKTTRSDYVPASPAVTQAPIAAQCAAAENAASRYRSIFGQVPVGIAYTTIEGCILEANAKLCEMLGYSTTEITALTTRELTFPDDRDRHDELRRQLIAGERDHFCAEKRYLHKNGTPIWVNRVVTLARDAANEAPYLIQVIEDVRERKKAETQMARLRRARKVTTACHRILVHATGEAAMLDAMCRVATESGGYKQVWIGLVTGDAKRPVHVAAHAGYRRGANLPMSSPTIFTPEGYYRGKMAEVVATGVPGIERYKHRDAPGADQHVYAVKFGWGASLTLPLISEGRILGGFEFNAAETDAFDNDEMALLTELAADIAFGISAQRAKRAHEQAEAELRGHELRFKATFDQAAVGISHTALSGEHMLVNHKLCAILGYSENEIIGRNCNDFTHPDDRAMDTRDRPLLLSGKIDQYAHQMRYVRKNGDVIWTHRTVSLARDAAGKLLHCIDVVEDISERKELERRFKETFDQAAVGIVHTALDGRYLHVNRRFCEMLGYSAKELVGRKAAELTHPDDQDKGAEYRQLMWDGKLDKFIEEKRYIRKDGSLLWTNRTVSLARDGSGKPMYFIRVIEDITERRGIEERYRATFDNAPVGIMHTSVGGYRILRANRKLVEMLGYSTDELLKMSTTDIIHPEHRFTDKHKYYEQLLRGEAHSFASERHFVRKDGSTVWVNRIVSLVRDASGKPDYFLRIVEDITERKLSALRRDMEHAVTGVLAESPTLTDAMPRIIRTVCESLGWACGIHWQWDDAIELLRGADAWHVDSEEVADFVRESRSVAKDAPTGSAQGPQQQSQGLVSSVWLSGAPVWIPDVTRWSGFRRGAIATKAGLHCAFGFPILAGERPLGVMEFFSRDIRQPDEALQRGVQAIGRQLGQFIQRKQAEDRQRESEARYRDMFDSNPLPMWVWDAQTLDVLTVNQAAVDHYGYSREEFQRMKLHDLWLPAERSRREESIRANAGNQTIYAQSKHVTKDQRVVSVEVTARAFKLGNRAVWLTLLNDVTERLRVEEKLLHLAHYDTLTDLPNRVLFYDRLRHSLAHAKRNGWITGVMFMDIDRFKHINDTLGHAVGDQLLQQVSERLVRSVRASDTVGRLGGDEFGIVLSNLSTPEDAGAIAQKIIANFDVPFTLEGAEFYVTPSIGITLAPRDGAEQDELIKNADAAMYRAKDAGRNNYQYYTPEMSVRGRALVRLEVSLRRALEHEEFLLHYQPKADVGSGKITGVEALLRWQRPEHGLVSPAEFIPVLEETGLIVQVGEWVLNAVCAQINAWLRAGVKPVPIAVNLSARQFLQPDLGSSIRRVLETHAVDPALIELEITESSLMVNAQEASRTLEYIKALGVALSIDDFGTGYSSLSYLKRFSINALKVDRSFVRDITTDVNDAAITLAVISMAHSLGLKVVAEGVETEQQLAFLAEHGCDQIQGYYFSKPLVAEECTRAIVQDRRLQRVSSASTKQ
jgi:diguanylate cyclase (GGDEF)-like protein/PAS domain S-box-containing protein